MHSEDHVAVKAYLRERYPDIACKRARDGFFTVYSPFVSFQGHAETEPLAWLDAYRKKVAQEQKRTFAYRLRKFFRCKFSY